MDAFAFAAIGVGMGMMMCGWKDYQLSCFLRTLFTGGDISTACEQPKPQILSIGDIVSGAVGGAASAAGTAAIGVLPKLLVGTTDGATIPIPPAK